MQLRAIFFGSFTNLKKSLQSQPFERATKVTCEGLAKKVLFLRATTPPPNPYLPPPVCVASPDTQMKCGAFLTFLTYLHLGLLTNLALHSNSSSTTPALTSSNVVSSMVDNVLHIWKHLALDLQACLNVFGINSVKATGVQHLRL